ncbi:cobyrinate a,c-diamide synthase [Sinorhizobium americanum]|uniref:Hydrogenobyrinate a,c-diamide synthase n=1 Tax=Sinorhizobium americanum TaxID=194963 RepID=A0A1L3LN13_9HYPH|nr:cobyrinate a,c-diamide synthase [Sinorhizobium americanum]APG91471.1 cobyrinic acid A,C-diamide synthase [Sinorhizobium americanum]OAP37475.1 cobyrinic acid a,c-diamide synthase [Sinorhizobium americanum]
MSGLMIAAPSSGSGKTTVTLGLLRALARRGVSIAPGKAGPDYIDPAFHTAASGKACLNYDPWAMRPELLLANAAAATKDGSTLIVEAMMGLYDGAADGTGSPADLAATLGLAVVLVVDCARLSHSVAALVRGYMDHRDDVRVAGVILNRVGSDRHEAMLRDALDRAGVAICGVLRQDGALKLPERHLGLVQAGEHGSLEAFIEHAAACVASVCDVEALLATASPLRGKPAQDARMLRPLGQRIAVARDVAFAFSYEHVLSGWMRQGADISFFSPLADEAPDAGADAIYLPGGYPELHAERLAGAWRFRTAVHVAAVRGARIFGECGGYMTLGEGLVAADGRRYEMLGLLPLVTSFAERKRHLGYRRVAPVDNAFFEGPMTAHEFHYSTIVSEGAAEPLFAVSDAAGVDLGNAGLRRGSVAGSFMHLIDLSE